MVKTVVIKYTRKKQSAYYTNIWSEWRGFSRGLKNSPPDCFSRHPAAALFESRRSNTIPKKESGRKKRPLSFLVGVAGLLPRAKNVPPARFCGILPPPCSNPATQIRYQKEKDVFWTSFSFWSEWRDSNPRPLGPEPSAIPNFATPRSDDYYSGMRMKSQVLFSEKPLILF